MPAPIAVAGLSLALGIHGLSQGADLATTMRLRDAAAASGGRYRFVEYNPGLAGQDRSAVYALKGAELATLVLIDQALERHHKRGWVWVLRGADLLGSGYLAARHCGLIRKVEAGAGPGHGGAR